MDALVQCCKVYSRISIAFASDYIESLHECSYLIEFIKRVEAKS